MSTSEQMATRKLEVMYTTNTGRRCSSILGRHEDSGTSEQCVRVCVLAGVRYGDGSESAVAGNMAGPTTHWWWLSIKGRLQCTSLRGQPLDKLRGDGRPGAVGQKRSTDVGVPRHTPWASSKEHSAVDGSEGWA